MDRRDDLLGLINAGWTTQVVRSACVLGIPDCLADDERTLQQLSVATGTHGASLHRLMRALTCLDLCIERDDGRYALTAVGRLLRRDDPQSLRAWALVVGGAQWTRWGELDVSVRTGASYKQRHLGEDGFGDLEADPAAAATFHEAMVQLTRRSADAIVMALDIGTCRCVVDVGGGQGELISTLLRRHAALRGILFDLPTGLIGAREALRRAGVADRCEIVGGDFFERIPPGADLYLLKSTLHNWDDDRAIRILANCRDAMRASGSVIAVERVMPERAGREDAALIRSDLNMLVALTGRERTASEFRRVFQRAGLEVESVAPSGSDFALIAGRAT
jgi:hypothetical protein